MSVSELRPPAVSWSSRFAWGAIIVFGLLFVGLTTYRIRARDLHEENPEQIAELSGATAKPAPSGADWPQWRGPNRDGVSAETGLLATLPEAGLKEMWHKPSGLGYSSVVIAQGRAVTMVQDGDEEAAVCWDAATGDEQWRFKYPAHFRHRQFGDGPRSTPAIAGDRVYTVGGTGIMHCLKLFPTTPAGEFVWREKLLEKFGGPQLDWGISFSPLVENGLVYIMPGGPYDNGLAALDGQTGSIVWHSFDGEASYSSPVAADLAGRRQIIYLTAEHLVGVAPDTGKLLWQFPWPSGVAHTPSSITTPVVIHRDVGDYVFIASGYDKGCALIKIERDGDGFAARQVYRNVNMRSVFSSPVVQGDYLYGFDDINLVCLNLRTGKRQWKASGKRPGDEFGFGKGSVLLADGKLIIFGDQGTLALAAADPHHYREEGRFQHCDQRATWTVPTLAGGRLYVRDFTRVVCYDLKAR